MVFTRNPATGEPELYGDVLFDAQGEDVVAGTHATQRVAQLAERMPAVAAELRRTAALLERHHADLCDIEFTIENGRLWMLQVRVGKRSARAALRMAIDMARDDSFPVSRADAVHRVAHLLADQAREFVRAPGAPPPDRRRIARLAGGCQRHDRDLVRGGRGSRCGRPERDPGAL